MKKFYLFLTVLVFTAIQMANAQAPQGIPYQAVARDSAGNLIKNHRIYLLFSIHDGTANGNVVFEEQHFVTTDALGLFSLNIGDGIGGNDGFNYTLSNVNWGSGAKFIQVKLDVTGGGYGFNNVDMGTTQMMSVPYALFAGNSNTPNGSAVGNTLRWDGNKWVADNAFFNNGNNVGIGITTPTEKLEVVGNVKISGKISANGGNANGDVSTALGYYTNANGYVSTALGLNTTASGGVSTALGFNTTASGDLSTALGLGTTSKSFAETSIGTFNTDFTPNSTNGINASDRLFVIGNGYDYYSRSDAMVVLKNGNTTINGTTTANSFVKANGTSSQYLMADGSTSAGTVATSMGTIGSTSTANGGTITSGVLSLAPADESNAGIVTTGAQNFAGNKSLNGKLGIGLNANYASAQLEVVSGSDIAIKAYPQNATYSQIGVLGTYNLDGYGTGIAGVAYGGTNPPTGNNDLGVYGSSSDIAIWSNGSLKVTDGTQGSGKVLTSDGNGKASWQTATSTTMGAIGTSSNANGAAISSGVLSLTPADGTNGGIVTSIAQTFGGKKNFADSAVALGFRATDSLTTKGFRATGTATANSFVKTNGTSSQYLMADGSISTGGSSTSVGSIGVSSTANAATITSGVLSLAPADGTNGGIVTSSAQTFGGKKTFADSAVAKGFRATDSITTKGFRATGTATANSFVKAGGTSSEILMANGTSSAIIRGTVLYDATVSNGTGFSVYRPFTGTYVIHFNTPFTTPPIVVVSLLNTIGFTNLSSVTTTGFRLDINNYNLTSSSDANFNFIVMAP